MNDFINAIKNNGGNKEGEEDPSKERFDEIKQEKAGLENTSPAEKRYSELKEEAKQEFVEESRKEASQEEEEDDESEGFITH